MGCGHWKLRRISFIHEKIIAGNGYFSFKEIPGRGLCALSYFFFTVGILYNLDEEGYGGRYCYQSEEEAQKALAEWDGNGNPGGNWIKHKGVREWRNPNFKE